MDEGKLFRDIVEVLSKDINVVGEIKRFVDYLGIDETDVVPLMQRYELGHCSSYDLMRRILSEWIKIQGTSATLGNLRGILIASEFVACADTLKDLDEMHPEPITRPAEWNKNSGEDETTEPIVFGFSNVVLNFVGRDEELEKLKTISESEDPLVIISGLGGIGKTELAKKFALTATLPDTQTGLIAKSWLSGESPGSLTASIVNFCLHLKLRLTDAEGKFLELKQMLKNIMAKLKSSKGFKKWLVVIDNVDEAHEEFRTAAETLHGFGADVFLLVTSRLRNIYGGEPEYLDVTELESKDSFQFVKKGLNITDDSKDNNRLNSTDDDIKALCKELGNYPLAICQAVAYIKQQKRFKPSYGVRNYLDELSKTETLGLDKDLELPKYRKATIKVWNITLDKIRESTDGPMALDLLDVMAFINPDEIHAEFLCKLFPLFYARQIDRSQIDGCLQILIQYSLISPDNVMDVQSIHRLVQLAVRSRMETITQHRRDVEMLMKFWTSFDSENWDRAEMTHILKIWEHSSSSSRSELDMTRVSTIKSVFDKLRKFGMVNESLKFAAEGCEFLAKFQYTGNYYQMLYCHALALKVKGRYEESHEKFKFAYENLKKLLGEDDENTLGAGHWVASVLISLEKYEESVEWGRKILHSQEKSENSDKDSIMATKHNLALALGHLGRREEALEIYNEILEWKKAHSKEDDPKVLAIRHNIAICHYHVGKYEEAHVIFENVVTLLEGHFGKDHPETVTSKSWLAVTSSRIGKIEDAIRISKDILKASEEVLGLDHPKTVIAKNNLLNFERMIQ